MTGQSGFVDGDKPVVPVERESADPAPEMFAVEESTSRRPSPLLVRLGLTALVLAVVGVAAEVVGIVIGNAGEWQSATLLAWFSIVVTALGFVGGVVAVIANRDRRLGVIAFVLGLIGNPLVLVGVLGALGG